MPSRRCLWQAPAMACSATAAAVVCRKPAMGAVHGDMWKQNRIGWNGSSFHEWRDSKVSRVSSSRVVCFAALGGRATSEEERWQREEARWLREEARWLREEARWEEERKAWAQESQAMAEEVRALKREIEQLRVETMEGRRPSSNGASLSALMSGLKQVLQSLPQTGESKSTPFPQEFPAVSETPALTFESSGNSDVFSNVGSSIPSMSEFSIDLVSEASSASASALQGSRPGTVSSSHPKSRKLLKKGAEGDEVKLLQDALAALGFYSGEEEMEFAMFSNETESAVKAWQASIGALEDGILSTDLLDYLFGRSGNSSPPTENPKTSPQAAKPKPSPSAESSEQRKTFAEDKRDVEGTVHEDIAPNRRVFLLGENRWEEPGRLFAKPSNNGTPSGPRPVFAEKCFSCRGEGVTMCTECEGTGELNVEDQFLEWVEDGSRCPYCEGSGAVPCDVCTGIGAISTM